MPIIVYTINVREIKIGASCFWLDSSALFLRATEERGITSYARKKRPIKIFLVHDKRPRDVPRLDNKWINMRYMTDVYPVTRGD